MPQLPSYERDAPSSPSPWRPPSPSLSDAKKRILVVEDHEDVGQMIVHVLNDLYEVVLCTDAQQALALAACDPVPDLVISDVMMPEMDGFEMVKRLKEMPATRFTPVIFLTARSGPLDIIAGIQAGARHYLTKPVEVDALRRKVRKILLGW